MSLERHKNYSFYHSSHIITSAFRNFGVKVYCEVTKSEKGLRWGIHLISKTPKYECIREEIRKWLYYTQGAYISSRKGAICGKEVGTGAIGQLTLLFENWHICDVFVEIWKWMQCKFRTFAISSVSSEYKFYATSEQSKKRFLFRWHLYCKAKY